MHSTRSYTTGLVKTSQPSEEERQPEEGILSNKFFPSLDASFSHIFINGLHYALHEAKYGHTHITSVRYICWTNKMYIRIYEKNERRIKWISFGWSCLAYFLNIIAKYIHIMSYLYIWLSGYVRMPFLPACVNLDANEILSWNVDRSRPLYAFITVVKDISHPREREKN